MDKYLWQYAIDKDDGEDEDRGNASPRRPLPERTSQSPAAASTDKVANTSPANKKCKLNVDKVADVPDDDDGLVYPHRCQALDCYITGNLALQAMSKGRESMAGYWCLLCQANSPQFRGDYPPWSMEDLCHIGDEAAQDKNPNQCVTQRPWFPFIPVAHHIIPLLHCMIGVGNDLLKMLRYIVNEFIENKIGVELSSYHGGSLNGKDI